MPKTLLRPTMTCRTVHLGTIFEPGCVRRGQCLLISARARSATPLYLGLSDGVNSCLMPRLRHKVPNSPPKISLPLSDRTHITADGVPSA